MTHEEFRQQYEAYDWETYQPLAVILASGNRVYIDMPEQATLALKELIITRRTNPHKQERYRYADVARLVPVVELPADPGGMSYAEFDPLIRKLVLQEPFQPFVVELKNGDRIEVNRPSPRAGRFMTVLEKSPPAFRSIEFDDIARILIKTEATSA